MFALKVLFNFSIFYLKNITNGLKKTLSAGKFFVSLHHIFPNRA